MNYAPRDLIALPTMPYDQRPESMPMVAEEVRTAIWHCNGNITDAAEMLKVPSARLRRYIRNSPYLTSELNESREQIKDIAEKNVVEALTDAEDAQRRDSMSKFVLTNLGRDRGYGQTGNKVSVTAGNISVNVGWADGTVFGEGAKVIEHDGESDGNVIDVDT